MTRLRHTDWLIGLTIFAAAFALRLMFLLNSPDREWPHSILYEGDAPTWVAWANALDRGEPFEFDLPLRSPAVAHTLHWLSPGETAPPFTRYKIIWCGFTALACALTYLAAAMAFNRRTALIAATLYSLSFGSYLISTSLNSEAMYACVLMGIVLATQLWCVRASMWKAIALGVLHGVALLIRPEHVLLLFLFACAMGCGLRKSEDSAEIQSQRRGGPHWRFGLVAVCVMCVASVAVCLPWAIKGAGAVHRFNTVSTSTIDYSTSPIPWTQDAQTFLESLPAFTRQGSLGAATYFNQTKGRSEITHADVGMFFLDVYGYVPEPLSKWSLVSMKGPLDFALANHPAADGGFSKAALAAPNEPNPLLQLARPDHLRLVNHGYAAGWKSITSDFSGWIGDVASKFTHFLDGVSLGFTSRNLPLGLSGQRRPVDLFTTVPHESSIPQGASIAWKTMIAAMILSGIVICCVQRRGATWLLIIAYKLIITILFYGYARQAVSILPVFFVLIGLPVDQFATRIGTRWKPRRAMVWTGIAAVILVLLAFDISGSIRRPRLSISGPLQFAPHWGQDSFESNQLLQIQRSTPTPSS